MSRSATTTGGGAGPRDAPRLTLNLFRHNIITYEVVNIDDHEFVVVCLGQPLAYSDEFLCSLMQNGVLVACNEPPLLLVICWHPLSFVL